MNVSTKKNKKIQTETCGLTKEKTTRRTDMIKYKISNKKNLGFNFDQTPDLNKVFYIVYKQIFITLSFLFIFKLLY